MQNTHSKRESGERIAEKFLTEKGFRLIERNYRYGRGEIDLIFDDKGILVFVEVINIADLILMVNRRTR